MFYFARKMIGGKAPCNPYVDTVDGVGKRLTISHEDVHIDYNVELQIPKNMRVEVKGKISCVRRDHLNLYLGSLLLLELDKCIM
jgi:hypothetical protein